MPELNLWLSRSIRVERVRSKVARIYPLERYDTPEKWEETISLLMLTEARDEDAKHYKPDTAEHVRTALEYLTESNLLEDTQCPLTQTGRKIFNQKMANLIVNAADRVDQRLDRGTGCAFILLIMFWPIIIATVALTAWLKG